jgi:type IV secretory pathway VirB10-like protein
MKQKFSWLLLLTLGLGTSPMAAEQEPTPTEVAPATESKPVEMSAPAPEAPAAEAPAAEAPVKVEEVAPKAEEAPVEKPKKKKSRRAKKSAHKNEGSVKPCVLSPGDVDQQAKQNGFALNKGAPSNTTVVAVPAEGKETTTAVVVAPEAAPSCSTGSCGK